MPHNYYLDLLLPCNDCILYAICNSNKQHLIFDCSLVKPCVADILDKYHCEFFPHATQPRYSFKTLVEPFGFSILIDRYTDRSVVIHLLDYRNHLVSHPKIFYQTRILL